MSNLTYRVISFVCLFVVFCGQVAPACAKTDVRDKWAVVIGINHFQDTSLGQLPIALKNALDVAKAFKDPHIGRFAPDHVMTALGSHATKSYIENDICKHWLDKKALPDDMVVFYFCTRALPAQNPKDLILCSYDTLASEPAASGIEFAELIKSTAKSLACRNIVCILDTEGAENVGKEKFDWNAKDLAQESGAAVLCASSQLSSLAPTASNNSLFTYVLVEVLTGGSGMLPLSAVADYLDRNIAKAAGSPGELPKPPLLAFAKDEVALASDVLGVAVKSHAKKEFAFGHPVSQLAYDHPELAMPRTSPESRIAQNRQSKGGDSEDQR